jgi:flagellar biosynthesis/type III secretory pathway protein FliH
MANPEVQSGAIENKAEVQAAAAERSKELLTSVEKSAEHSPEKQAERASEARAEATKEALMSRERGSAESKQGGEPQGVSLTHATKKQRKNSYKSTMKQIRSEMSPVERSFSKVIHNQVIEKASAVIGNTAARPNAILAGSISATFLTLVIYLFAKYYGYPLSGFESIATFAVGWAIGLLYDYARLMVAGRRS